MEYKGKYTNTKKSENTSHHEYEPECSQKQYLKWKKLLLLYYRTMTREQIENLIQSFKDDAEMSSIFWERVSYESFFTDLEDIWLLIQPLSNKPLACRSKELLQVQIVDKKDASTALDMKWYMDKVDNFINGKLKAFAWLKVVEAHDTWDEKLLKNNKERWVFTKRYILYV